jgi:dienelactone hydrolase
MNMRRSAFSMTGLMAFAFAAPFLTAAALAAAGPAPLPEPDPKTKNMSRQQIQMRALDGCLISQSRLQQTTRDAVRAACTCYASGTVRAMTNPEVQAFRDTSVFNDSAREKALAQLDRCKLVRPS